MMVGVRNKVQQGQELTKNAVHSAAVRTEKYCHQPTSTLCEVSELQSLWACLVILDDHGHINLRMTLAVLIKAAGQCAAMKWRMARNTLHNLFHGNALDCCCGSVPAKPEVAHNAAMTSVFNESWQGP